MLVPIAAALTTDQVAQCRQALAGIDWVDGRATAGHLSMPVKQNEQISEDHPVGRRLGQMLLDVLGRNPLFVSAALPARIVPPLFNRYAEGQSYGPHIDGSVRPMPDAPLRVRTDLAATLFLSDADAYDGGELVIDDTFGPQRVKLAAGSLILYPASSVHHVTPVTRGVRLASFFWIQSMVRHDHRRRMLFDLDLTVQRLRRDVPQHSAILELTALYHNLMREWADV
ncbi:MAG TPA: Fe2+-dependent dioxygenase [Steroidobacteraceae bacterium]|nr:Fe2+-dependent dioxygenase [Steroidobacteraceae bacterium]